MDPPHSNFCSPGLRSWANELLHLLALCSRIAKAPGGCGPKCQAHPFALTGRKADQKIIRSCKTVDKQSTDIA